MFLISVSPSRFIECVLRINRQKLIITSLGSSANTLYTSGGIAPKVGLVFALTVVRITDEKRSVWEETADNCSTWPPLANPK
ncbi:hypothetical protein N7519_000334 [Penicillium mononematosum]|uniref:uncharacterized protein n=1 Tax=Penicillium mononematosum TaxID=268346 RepID=UPI00254702DD|nr:uncharacterized protein N7519_000334 [Penicillium mononematosum]KAJ6190313.1 hypothetical protein N7519_000334 [Penicillium mononematosum]